MKKKKKKKKQEYTPSFAVPEDIAECFVSVCSIDKRTQNPRTCSVLFQTHRQKSQANKAPLFDQGKKYSEWCKSNIQSRYQSHADIDQFTRAQKVDSAYVFVCSSLSLLQRESGQYHWIWSDFLHAWAVVSSLFCAQRILYQMLYSLNYSAGQGSLPKEMGN